MDYSLHPARRDNIWYRGYEGSVASKIVLESNQKCISLGPSQNIWPGRPIANPYPSFPSLVFSRFYFIMWLLPWHPPPSPPCLLIAPSSSRVCPPPGSIIHLVPYPDFGAVCRDWKDRKKKERRKKILVDLVDPSARLLITAKQETKDRGRPDNNGDLYPPLFPYSLLSKLE